MHPWVEAAMVNYPDLRQHLLIVTVRWRTGHAAMTAAAAT